VAQLLAVWRDLARDLALAIHDGRAELRQPDLLDEMTTVGANLEPAAVTRFLSRLDGAVAALDAYANPELMLDALLLEWPHRRAAA
jgi:hypothetical protein